MNEPRASGKDCEVRIEEDKLVVDRPGGFQMLRQVTKVWKEGPQYLADALNGPSKEVLLEALTANKQLLVAIVRSIREKDESAVPDVDQPPEKLGPRELVTLLSKALTKNKTAVAAALGENKELVADWLKSHKELLGIFLQGDVHLFTRDLVSMEIRQARSGDGYLEIQALGVTDPIHVDFDESHALEFKELIHELDATVVAAAPGRTHTPTQ